MVINNLVTWIKNNQTRAAAIAVLLAALAYTCLLYTSPSPRDVEESRMPSSA